METILSARSTEEALTFGRQILYYDKEVWRANAGGILRDALEVKFAQSTHARQALLATAGTILALATVQDPLWSIGLKESDRSSMDRRSWKGKNILGFMLTDLRMQLTGRY